MAMSEHNATPDLAQKTLQGVFWSYSTFLGGKVLTFLSTIILARLLLPEQFGLVGYCLIVIQYLDILNSAGINNSLIARREKLDEAANAAFIANIVLGVISFVLTWLIAPWAAVFFKTEELIPVLRLMGLSLPLSGLGMVPDTLLQRHLRFRTRMLPEVSKNLIKGLVSIVLAWMGMGVWSLVWGQLAGTCIATVLAWILAGWKPTWRFDAAATREIATYGFHIMLLEVAGAFRNNVDYLLVGRMLGAAALGYYTMAYRIPELLIRSVNIVVGRVSLPVMSMAQSDREQLRSFYFGYLRSLSMIIFPLAVGLALTAPIFIPLFLSDQWNPAILPTTLISLALGIAAMGFIPGVLYKATGRPELLTRLNFIKVPLAVTVLWYSTRWGITGVAAGQIAISIFSLALDTLTANYVMRYPARDLLRALAPTFLSTLGMTFALLVLIRILPFSELWEFILMIPAGVLIYFLVLWALDRETVRAGIDLVRRTFIKVPVGAGSDA
jgi:O-antigen/teichoic acid export membrane protein